MALFHRESDRFQSVVETTNACPRWPVERSERAPGRALCGRSRSGPQTRTRPQPADMADRRDRNHDVVPFSEHGREWRSDRAAAAGDENVRFVGVHYAILRSAELFHGDMLRLVALDLILRVIRTGVTQVALDWVVRVWTLMILPVTTQLPSSSARGCRL